MKSVNYQLRAAYVAALSGLTVNTIPVPTYYLSAPENETSKIYITLNNIANLDASSKQTANTDSTMQLQIHTWDDNGFSGKNADDVANAVFALVHLLPTQKFDLIAHGFQIVDTRLVNDVVQELRGEGVRQYIQRVITFNHNIYHL
jgi:hypothetical protein